MPCRWVRRGCGARGASPAWSSCCRPRRCARSSVFAPSTCRAHWRRDRVRPHGLADFPLDAAIGSPVVSGRKGGLARARMTVLVLFWLNVLLLSFFASLTLQPRLLGFAKGGKWYLTWFAVGLITLMDELTSVFYAPAEAHRFIGTQAIFFIAATSLLMRVLSTRMVEIAQILELHDMRGGGVYSFAYFVLGPVASCVVGARTGAGLPHAVAVVTVGVASCILAYSGIESVIQTAGLVDSWRDIARAYWFLALTVGIVTPIISALALSAPIDLAAHEGDLITYWATVVGNVPFGVVVGFVGSIILVMAVNTAYVASSELLERVAHRYRFDWLIATNRRASLYRIHILNGALYTSIILLTAGSQAVLAEMYAVSLLASFCINIGCLLIYRYFQGTKEIRAYHTSRTGTLLLEFMLLACFVYLAAHRPYGTGLWAAVVGVLLAAGIPFSRRYGPEAREIRRSDYAMEMLLALGEADGPLHVWFRRPGEVEAGQQAAGSVFITLFSSRHTIPPKVGPSHYRFPIQGGSVYRTITVLLTLLEEELEGCDVTVHFGWPTASWLDRMATGVFVANLMRLPRLFPTLRFAIDYLPPSGTHRDRRQTISSRILPFGPRLGIRMRRGS